MEEQSAKSQLRSASFSFLYLDLLKIHHQVIQSLSNLKRFLTDVTFL